MKPTIISLSGYAQHGKSTSCQILSEILTAKHKKCLRISYGDYVKEIATKYYGWDGNKDEKGRALLQWLGTDKIRAINPTFWVDTVIRLVDVIGDDYDYVLIDDARFPDEVEAWGGDGIKTVHVCRPNFESNLTEEQKNHASETAMDGFRFDFGIQAYDLFQLRDRIKELADRI